MNRLLLLCCVVLLVIGLAGCDLINQPQAAKRSGPGKDLVINEVFTIAPEKYYAYSWIELMNATTHPISLASQSSPATMYSVGAAGAFQVSHDDGSNWRMIDVGTGEFNAVNFGLPDTAIIVGDNGLVRKVFHNDTADTYRYVDMPFPRTVNLHDVNVQTPGRLILVVGDNGTIGMSTNRGVAWRFSNNAAYATKNLRTISFIDQANIYACGDNGTILRGGINLNYVVQSPPPIHNNVNFHAIGFVGVNSANDQASKGYVVGDGGVIDTTTSLGTIWKQDSSGTTANLRALFIPPSGEPAFRAGNVWVVGDGGTILHTSDTIWHPQKSGTTANLYSVQFIDSLRGWAVGDGGVVVVTTNAGRTWTTRQTAATGQLRDVTLLQLSANLITQYVLLIEGIRDHVFFDPGTQTTNEDVIVYTDTGLIPLSGGITIINSQLSSTLPDIPPGGFIVINNDSAKFKDHTTVGHSNVTQVNAALLVDSAIGNFDPATGIFRFSVLDQFHWKLPSAGEMRLYKASAQFIRTGGGTFVAVSSSATVIDVVRWGGYMATHNEFRDGLSFPNNHPAGRIPELSSLARYFNDLSVDVNTESTASSFYLTDPGKREQPLPGWASQRGK